MIRLVQIAVTAIILAMSASFASAAPATNLGNVGTSVMDGLTEVHGRHQACRRDRRGWHRHVRRRGDWQRRSCRQWRGRGPRPRDCVKVGPVYFCDH